MRCLPVEHDLMHRPTLGRATAYHALDTVLGHELERAHRTALDRLPALDRQLERSRDEGELFEGVAAVRHLGRQRVVLALIREALVVEGFEDDIDLLLKERPVGLLVAQWGAERFYLACMVAATDAKDDSAAGGGVNSSEVLRQPQRVPHRSDIEAATDLDVFRSVREVQCHKDGVRNAFSAFALEVMLGHPETVVAKAIHERGHGFGLAERSCEVSVRVTPLVDGRSAITDVVEVGMPGIEAVKRGDHREFSVPYYRRIAGYRISECQSAGMRTWRLHRTNRDSGRRSATSSVSSLSFMATRKVLQRRKLVLPQSLRQRSFMAFPDGR